MKQPTEPAPGGDGHEHSAARHPSAGRSLSGGRHPDPVAPEPVLRTMLPATPPAAIDGSATWAAPGEAAPGETGRAEDAPGEAAPGETGRAEDAPGETGRAEAGRPEVGAAGPIANRLGGRRAVAWWRGLPAVVQVLIIYVVSRWLDFLVIGRVARFQAPSLWNGPAPGYLGVVDLWDGDWYRRIAASGYPDELPIDGYGYVAQNEWAFYPLYPMSVRAVMRLFGTGWPVSASLVSLICGAVAVVMMRRLMEGIAGRAVAMWTVALFCFFPSAPVLQLAYTESLSIMLLVWALWCLHRRRYVQAIPVVLLIGFARPIGVPVAAVVGVHVLTRLWRRRAEPVTGSAFAAMAALSVAAAVAAIEWTVVVGLSTGVSDGYTQTMAAWRSNHEIVLFKPWLGTSQYFLGTWTGPFVLVVVTLLAIWMLTHPTARVIAGDLRVWVVSYLVYLVVVLDPSTSVARYLLPLFPVGAVMVAASRSPAYRRALLLAFVAGQVLWVSWLWKFSPPTDWPP